MTPKRRGGRGGGRGRRQLNEAARLTGELLDAGFTKKDVGQIIGRDSSLVSQFFTKNKGASFVDALTAAVREFQVGEATTVDELKAVAQPHVQRRRAASGQAARVRPKDQIVTPGQSRMARAGRQHIASGGARLLPVIEDTAAARGKVAFTVRAAKGSFLVDAGRADDSPGVRRNVQRRRDGTESRDYGRSHGPGQSAGFDAAEWAQRVEAADGDVTAAVRGWMEETGRIRPGARITHLEVRGWV